MNFLNLKELMLSNTFDNRALCITILGYAYHSVQGIISTYYVAKRNGNGYSYCDMYILDDCIVVHDRCERRICIVLMHNNEFITEFTIDQDNRKLCRRLFMDFVGKNLYE